MSAQSLRLLGSEELTVVTAHYAAPRAEERKATGSALVFRIGAEWLALPTVLFDRVADVSPVHTVPHRRKGVPIGLVTVGGDLVVHLSLGEMLSVSGAIDASAAEPVANGRRRLIVLTDARGRLATTADEVWGVYHYHHEQLRSAPSTLTRALVSFTTAMLDVDGRMAGLLDGPRLMDALSAGLA
jgi:chemotaxis-related protein WspD